MPQEPLEIEEFILRPHIRFQKNFQKYSWFYKTLAFFAAYSIWVVGFRLLTLTFIAYFTISPTSHFQDISEAFSSNEVSLMGLSAFLFVGLMHWLNPLAPTSLKEVIN